MHRLITNSTFYIPLMTGFFGVFGALLGSFLHWFLARKSKQQDDEWNFFVNTTAEVLSVIDITSDTNIKIGLIANSDNWAKKFQNHLEELRRIKVILELKYSEETQKAFKSFYEACTNFASETRKDDWDFNQIEKFNSYKIFQQKKGEWLNILRKRLK